MHGLNYWKRIDIVMLLGQLEVEKYLNYIPNREYIFKHNSTKWKSTGSHDDYARAKQIETFEEIYKLFQWLEVAYIEEIYELNNLFAFEAIRNAILVLETENRNETNMLILSKIHQVIRLAKS